MKKNIHFLTRRVLNSMQNEPFDTDAAWNKIKPITRKKHILQPLFYKYVAAIILIISIGGYLWYSRTPVPLPQTIKPSTITQATPRIELILANGERLQLKNMQQEATRQEQEPMISRDSLDYLLRCLANSVSEKKDTQKYNRLNVPKGGAYSFQLPDGTTVWINSESSLKFPARFEENKREVYLEGEAYFKVVRNESAPFQVITGDKKITVLGTSFNVSAYPEDSKWQATLVEGQVSIRYGTREEILFPSQQCTIDNQELKIEKVDTELYTSWIDGKFNFKGYRLEDIVKKLQKWYDFTIAYENEELKDMLFRGTIYKHDPLDVAFRYIEETTNIKFEINGKNITVKNK